MRTRGYKSQSNECVKCALGVTSLKVITAENAHWGLQIAKQSVRKMRTSGYKVESTHCVNSAVGVTSSKAISAENAY